LVLAAPLLPQAPLTGSLLALGCCLPDVDSLSRCFGKCAFLYWHQKYTHSLAFVAGCTVLAWWLLRHQGEPWAAIGLAIGLLIHIGLDCCNTFGAAALWPISARRWSREWLFFIDTPVTVLTVIAVLLAFVPQVAERLSSSATAIAYAVTLAAYISLRIVLSLRAWRSAPAATISLIPSAFVPWRFYGVARASTDVHTFTLDCLQHRILDEHWVPTLDTQWASATNPLSEFQAMRDLSPAYHVLSATPCNDGTILTCRDLRTRNFGGRFGELQIVVDGTGNIVRSTFHV
jgi:membrane-bound metal-dependent hydrolase YbcI (DUF457 family)